MLYETIGIVSAPDGFLNKNSSLLTLLCVCVQVRPLAGNKVNIAEVKEFVASFPSPLSHPRIKPNVFAPQLTLFSVAA